VKNGILVYQQERNNDTKKYPGVVEAQVTHLKEEGRTILLSKSQKPQK